MIERKLVKSGLSSNTIALPKEWVTRNKLAKGNSIYLEEENNRLILTPKKIKEKKLGAEYVLFTDAQGIRSIIRNIIAGYLTNAGNIKLKGKDLRHKLPEIKNIITQLAGLEVIEETSDTLVLKDFINIEEITIPHLVRRTDNILRSLFIDTLECIKTHDAGLAETIRIRDKEVNRLTYLIYKSLNHVVEHLNEVHSHGISPNNLMHCWELNGHLEKIGDEIKRLAMAIPKAQLTKSESTEMEHLLKGVMEFYLSTMMALYKHDLSLADEHAEIIDTLTKKCDTYLASLKSLNGRQIIARMKYSVSHINDISRLIYYLTFVKVPMKPDEL